MRKLLGKKYIRGFTLIELLMVVAIVGIISTIIISQVKSAQGKAKMSRLVTQMKEIEKAFLFTYLDENRNDFWTEAELGITNPKLSDLIAIETGPLSGFSDYMPNSPSAIWGAWGSTEYNYDFDGTYRPECDSANGSGVNLLIPGLVNAQKQLIDKYVDGEEDPDCGRIVWKSGISSGALWYRISYDGDW